MNLQTRKLNMIEYLIGLQDEKVEEGILITDVFDTRQDPAKIKDKK